MTEPVSLDQSVNGYFISAPWRSSGKTLVTVGLAAAAFHRGLHIQTFKKGPDYIDPQWLGQASGQPCYNLDPRLQSQHELLLTYRQYASSASLSLIEGTMGLHDGLETDGSDSNAAIARLLDTPIVLVVDCRGMHRTVAALVNGIQRFDPAVPFAGVILNRLRSTRHEEKIQRAIAEYCDLKMLGSIAENPDVTIEERELGLVPSAQLADAARYIESARELLEGGCDLDAFFTVSGKTPVQSENTLTASVAMSSGNLAESTTAVAEIDERSAAGKSEAGQRLGEEVVTVGIARDQAFNFYYADDLALLESRGVNLVKLSPMIDEFPDGLDGLLLGGGFPERHAAALADNAEFRQKLKLAIRDGLPVRAECAGLMYLCRSLNLAGQRYPMVSAIAGEVTMHKRPSGRGYVRLRYLSTDKNDAYSVPVERILAAHEFHHSQISFDSPPDFAYQVVRGYGVDGQNDGIRLNNVMASYAHFRHSQATPWVDWFYDQICQQKNTRRLQHV